MAEFVRADRESVAVVEAFLAREMAGGTRLGRPVFAAGRLGATVAALAGAHAITFGRLICLSGRAGARLRASDAPTLTPGAALDRLGGLFVHECVHIAQYRAEGTRGFLVKYLSSYINSIKCQRSLTRCARITAYSSIPFERQAYAIEDRWRTAEADTRASSDS